MAWLDVDEKCNSCGAVTKPAKGFNKQNLKRLVEIRKPTFNEIFFLFILIALTLVAWAYRQDVNALTYNFNACMNGSITQPQQQGNSNPFPVINSSVINEMFNATLNKSEGG